MADELKQMMDCHTIYPVQKQNRVVRGKMTEVDIPFFPGYVFLYTDDKIVDYRAINRLPGVIRIVSYPDSTYELRNADEEFAIMLYRCEGELTKVPVYKEGEKIVLGKGIFEGCYAKIIKVDGRNKRMKVEIKLAFSYINTWLEYKEV